MTKKKQVLPKTIVIQVVTDMSNVQLKRLVRVVLDDMAGAANQFSVKSVTVDAIRDVEREV